MRVKRYLVEYSTRNEKNGITFNSSNDFASLEEAERFVDDLKRTYPVDEIGTSLTHSKLSVKQPSLIYKDIDDIIYKDRDNIVYSKDIDDIGYKEIILGCIDALKRLYEDIYFDRNDIERDYKMSCVSVAEDKLRTVAICVLDCLEWR